MKFRKGRALAAAAIAGTFIVMALPTVGSASGGGVSANSFNSNYTTMAALSHIAAAGKGGIGVILPDEVSSNRYVEFDAPNLTTALTDAGLPPADLNVQNALGSVSTEISIAQGDIAAGDKVLIMDPIDSPTGITIEQDAAKAGVKVVDYDRLTVGGSAQYYVSFNNVSVGTLIGRGEISCLAAWHIKKPLLYVMNGSTTTDNNAVLFAQGYDKVLNAKGFKASVGGAGNAKTINETGTGTWTPSQALTDFQGAYSKNAKINAVLTPNDENAAPIISYLQGKGLKPEKIPFTGQDATLTGFQNIISGYQCGTVYKPIWQEAQAAAALALYLRDGKTPPKALVNGKTKDPTTSRQVPSVLLTATWDTAKKIESTVIANGVINAVSLCTTARPSVSGDKSIPTYKADCKKYGIK
ncbi:MAG TPA: substrate-binding domain-containing protein [Acidimicrobiales bacterium]|nr:substrate-binding domain-containing protein [Acidimicrobiales bacterium]